MKIKKPVGLMANSLVGTGKWLIAQISAIFVIQMDDKYFYWGNHMLSVRLPKNVEKRLDRLAKKTGRTKTYYVREALLDHIDDLEDIYFSIGRLEKPAKRWTLDDLEREVDLEG